MPAAHTPPRPRAVLRVGVAGHRLTRLLQSDVDLACVRIHVRAALAEVQRLAEQVVAECTDVYHGALRLLAISALDEGADQIAVEEAMGLGFVLHASLPSEAERYTSTFEGPAKSDTVDPKATFDRLIGGAECVQVMDGRPNAVVDCGAHAAVSRCVLRHSDILVVVWDGASHPSRDRTADVIAQARAWQVPMVVIDPRSPEAWRAQLDGDISGTEKGGIAAAVRAALAPPAPNPDDHGRDRLRQYLHTRPAGGVGGLFASIVKFVAWERPVTPRVVTLGPSIARARTEWHALWNRPVPVDPEIARPINHMLGEYYVWADGLGNRFGTLHRDTSTAPFLLALLAALVAAHIGNQAVLVAPVVAAWLVFLLYRRAVAAKYHDRWIDYRSLAEQLRQLAFLWPLGRPLRALRIRGESATEAPQFAWIGWYARAVAREAGLFPCVFTPERLTECRAMLIERFIVPQCAYHDRTVKRFQAVQRRLHMLALALFWATLVLATLRLVIQALPHHWVLETAAAAAILLPAVAAAVHGFLGLGDFSNLARRSKRMAEELRPLTTVTATSATPETIETLGDMAEAAAEAMGEEVLNWRVFVRLKAPSLG
jgi:hypothetical protein